MSNLTTRALQAIQEEIFNLQNGYRDHQSQWWALRLAYEAVRCAWYFCDNGSAEKLGEVREALADLERVLEQARVASK
jgi:hypothetical protein